MWREAYGVETTNFPKMLAYLHVIAAVTVSLQRGEIEDTILCLTLGTLMVKTLLICAGFLKILSNEASASKKLSTWKEFHSFLL